MASCGSRDLGVTLYGGLPVVGVVLIPIQSFSEASRAASTQDGHLKTVWEIFVIYGASCFVLGISPGGLVAKHCGNIRKTALSLLSVAVG